MDKILKLGRMLWRQSRDISVCNYANHTCYEIFTNHGTLKLICDKHTNKYYVIDNNVNVPVQSINSELLR